MEPCGAAGAGGFSAAGVFFNFLFFFAGALGVPGAFLFGAAILPQESRREGPCLYVLPCEAQRCFREHGARVNVTGGQSPSVIASDNQPNHLVDAFLFSEVLAGRVGKSRLTVLHMKNDTIITK